MEENSGYVIGKYLVEKRKNKDPNLKAIQYKSQFYNKCFFKIKTQQSKCERFLFIQKLGYDKDN